MCSRVPAVSALVELRLKVMVEVRISSNIVLG